MPRTYSGHVPTCFDQHIRIPDREDWLILPLSQTRDSGPFDTSNFQACINILGGESETCEVHRFGHWGLGWYEIIIVHPSRLSEVEDIEAKYNGHKNWNHWNVSLWINNDEGLYRLARQCVYSNLNRTKAAEVFLELVGQAKTPDGAPYSLSSVRAAMSGM